jgi:hypothetical protein
MKHLSDITEEKLEAGWVYKFKSDETLLNGDSDETIWSTLFYDKSMFIFIIRIDVDIKAASHDFESIMKELISYSNKYNLELRSMKRNY